MIYQIQFSPEHLDLAIRAIGVLPYAEASELMDIIRIQILTQNQAELLRLQELKAQEARQVKKGHANGVNLEGEPTVEIVEVGTIN